MPALFKGFLCYYGVRIVGRGYNDHICYLRIKQLMKIVKIGNFFSEFFLHPLKFPGIVVANRCEDRILYHSFEQFRCMNPAHIADSDNRIS